MTPTATYRLQLQPDFPFSAAEKAVPYLAALGVSHLHLSPVLEAVPGSTHGYDVVDHSAVRAELGGEEGLRRLARTAREHGLGLVLDIVPNHMAAAPGHNKALWEVLREGRDSPYARWFDIDWDAGHGKLLLPVLPGPIGDELDALRVEGGLLHHGDQRFPLAPGTEHLPLPELLDAQHYRLAWWRLARTELNYRRFFTISELIGVRVEDPVVFAATHAKILELVRDGVVEGLRIDHPDGLADPERYLRRLHEATGGECWTVVEKILADDEPLPAGWRVAGTTGYDALRHIDGLFTDPVGAGELERRYREAAGPAADRGGYWEGTVRRAAYKVVIHELAAEIAFLVRTAERICAGDPALRDHAPWALRTAIQELLVRVPVYRPYTTAGGPVPEAAEAAVSQEAARQAKAAFAVEREAAAVDVVRELALGRLGTGPDHTAFCARFAQTASALRAKSVEDTAFYRYVPLISANEVGGDPGAPAVSPERFHLYCARLARDWPATGTVLTTHDTKRSADVRAGIAALSECPEQWGELLERVAGVPSPDPQVAWQAWQTAVGFTPGGDDPRTGFGAPGFGAPGFGTAGFEDPGFEEAGFEEPGFREPGFGEPGFGEQSAGEHGFGAARPPGFFGEPGHGPVAFAEPAFAEPGFAEPGFAESGPGEVRPGGPGVPDGSRMVPALLKSVREAGLHTSWTEADPLYERAVTDFVEAGPAGPARRTVARFAQALAPYARASALGAALVQLTMPGVPDLYQGTERAYFALVDPDNRGRFRTGPPDGKTVVTTAALALRRARPEVFGESGTYAPLAATGPAAAHCLAFSRSGEVITAVTRLPLRLARAGGWGDTELVLPAGRWADLLASPGRELAGGPVPVAELFADGPVALLSRLG